MKKNTSKVVAMILVLIFIIMTVYSYLYIYNNQTHKCIANHCPICEQIEMLENYLHKIESALPVFMILTVFIIFLFLSDGKANSKANQLKTLITLKVLLLN